MSNPVSPNYYSPLDNAGLRADRLSRAELQVIIFNINNNNNNYYYY